VNHYFAPCVMHLSVHCAAMCTAPYERQVDWSAMNWNGSGRKRSWISQRSITKPRWVIWERVRKPATKVTRIPP